MTITLTHDQEAWINARIAIGEFTSVEAAVRQLIDAAIAKIGDESDDMSWAKPLVDEARADVARGDLMTLEEHRARNAARIAALKG